MVACRCTFPFDELPLFSMDTREGSFCLLCWLDEVSSGEAVFEYSNNELDLYSSLIKLCYWQQFMR